MTGKTHCALDLAHHELGALLMIITMCAFMCKMCFNVLQSTNLCNAVICTNWITQT